MVYSLRINSANYRQVVHYLGGVREQFADHSSASTVRGEFVNGRSNGKSLLAGSHRGQSLPVANRIRQIGVKQFAEFGFVIPKIDLRRRPVHEQVNQPSSFRRKMRNSR